jgi:hypothetical protein
VLDTLSRSGGQPQTILGGGMGGALAGGGPAGMAGMPPDRAQVAAAVARYQALRDFRARLYGCLTARPDASFELVDAIFACRCDGTRKTIPGWEYQFTAAIGLTAGLRGCPVHLLIRLPSGSVFVLLSSFQEEGRTSAGRPVMSFSISTSMPCSLSCPSGRSDRPEMTTLRYRNDDSKAGQVPTAPWMPETVSPYATWAYEAVLGSPGADAARGLSGRAGAARGLIRAGLRIGHGWPWRDPGQVVFGDSLLGSQPAQ